MPTVTQRQNAKERAEYITELIKESGAEGVNGAVICEDCGLNNKQRSVIMTRLMEKESRIKRISGSNRVPVYIWQEAKEEPKKEEPAPNPLPATTHSAFLKNRYKKQYNNEGYLDMTASKAIDNVEKDLITPKAGEIWTSEESSGKRVYVYILAVNDDTAQCVRMYDRKEFIAAETLTNPINIPLGALDLVGDLTRITFKAKKYLVKRERKCVEAHLASVRTVVAKLMGIEPTVTVTPVPGPERIVTKEVVKEVPVEKVVEKIVYRDKAPVEVPDGYISEQEAKIADLQHQMEIWRSAFWAVAKNRSESAKNS